MREIKFRAWDGIRMTTSGIMFNCSNGKLETPEGARMITMQFTGLHDRNGKEWYEGDIVRVTELAPCHVTYWNEDEMGWKIMMIGTRNWFNINAPLFEIIGNIYENPELL